MARMTSYLEMAASQTNEFSLDTSELIKLPGYAFDSELMSSAMKDDTFSGIVQVGQGSDSYVFRVDNTALHVYGRKVHDCLDPNKLSAYASLMNQAAAQVIDDFVGNVALRVNPVTSFGVRNFVYNGCSFQAGYTLAPFIVGEKLSEVRSFHELRVLGNMSPMFIKDQIEHIVSRKLGHRPDIHPMNVKIVPGKNGDITFVVTDLESYVKTSQFHNAISN